MKVIIIEGLDNTGKSTVINTIKTDVEQAGKKAIIYHCAKPIGNTFKEQSDYQNLFFADLAKQIINNKVYKSADVIILDRAWYGEYVYGQLYREHNSFDIQMNINMVEESLKSYFSEDELSFILLNTSNIDFSIEQDDGLSISEANVQKIKNEQEKFEEVFNLSNLKNKGIIFVNSGLNFRKPSAIMYDVEKITKYKESLC